MDRASAFPKPFDAENEANTKRETMKRERESQITHRRREKTPVFGDRTLEKKHQEERHIKTRFFGDKRGWIGPRPFHPFDAETKRIRNEKQSKRERKKITRKRKLVTGGR